MSHNKTVIGQRKKPFAEAVSKLKKIITFPIKEYKFFKKEGFKNPAWITICCLVGRLNSNLDWVDNRFFSFIGLRTYGTKFFQAGFHLGWNPETFCRISWHKEITISAATGYVIDNPDIAHRWKDKKKVYENRKLYLYSPWLIESWFNYIGPSKRVVVDYNGDEQIETHKFSYTVERKKYPWWNSYRVVNRYECDETEFERDLDNYLMGGY